MSIKIGQASLGETGGWNQQPGNQFQFAPPREG